MKAKHYCLLAVLLLFATFFLSSCQSNINVEPQEITLTVGDTYVLSGTVQNGTMTMKNAQMDSWESSNPKVATVDDYGLVTAVSPGKSTVTAYYKKQKDSCSVTVIEGSKN